MRNINSANKRIIAFLLLVIMVVCSSIFVVSCKEPEVINSYEYYSNSFQYSELYNAEERIYDVNETATDYATYYFDDSISQQKCNRFVTFAEQLLGYLKLEDKLLKFFVSDNIKTPRAENESNTIYYSTSNTKTVEFIHYVLQGLFH